MLMTKGSTHVAHLFEDELGVVKRAPYRVGVVAAFIVFSLVVLHHLFTIFVLEDNVGGNNRGLT
jgi:hypothetical protein